MTKKDEFRRKLCYELGGEYTLRDFYSYKQIYRKLDNSYELEIGFFDLKAKQLIITLFDEGDMVEAVYAALTYKEVESAIKALVEKYTGKEFVVLSDGEKTRPNVTIGTYK